MSAYTDAYKSLEDLTSLINYVTATTEEEWVVDVVRTENKNCLYGHVVDWYHGKGYTGDITAIWDAFEEVASSYYVYPINDGQNPKYQQPTPRQRCIALLQNLQDGTELRTWEAMQEEAKLYESKK